MACTSVVSVLYFPILSHYDALTLQFSKCAFWINTPPTDPSQCDNEIDATWWPTLEPMQVALTDDQVLNQCKWCHLVTQFTTGATGTLVSKFATDATTATWWPNLQLVQVAPSADHIFNQCKRHHLVGKFTKLQTMQVALFGGQVHNQCW